MMKFRRLGKSDLEVSVIGYGGWEIGGVGWKVGAEEESIEAVRSAFESGVNFFDTAPVYGFGRSEEVVADALSDVRKDVIIATKVGLIWDDAKHVKRCLRKESVLHEIDESLRRLKTDHVDLYQIHWPDPETPLEETAEALQRILEQGKARYIGVSNFDIGQMEEISKYIPVVSLQVSYSMLNRYIEKEIFDYVREHDIGIIPYSPLERGLLTGAISEDYVVGENDARRYDKNFTDKERFRKNIERVEKLKKVSTRLGISMPQLAISWLLYHPEVRVVIVGSANPEHVKQNISAAEIELDTEVFAEINDILSDEELFENLYPTRPA